MKLLTGISLIGKFWQEKVNAQIFRWNLLLIIVQFVYLFFRFNDLPPQVPLYFSLPWGAQQLANASNLFLLPIAAVTIALVNNFIAAFYLESLPLFSRLFIIFSLVFSLLSGIAVFEIINLVI